MPETEFIYGKNVFSKNFIYKYYREDSDEFKFLKFLYDSQDDSQKCAYEEHMTVVLLFKSKKERDTFELYMSKRMDGMESYIHADDNIYGVSDLQPKAAVEIKFRISVGKFLIEELDKFRQHKRKIWKAMNVTCGKIKS